MSGKGREGGRAHDAARTALAASLRARCPALYQTVVTHARQSVDPLVEEDLEYEEAERASVAAVVDYELVALERGDECEPTPAATLSQARRAARQGVPIDIVLGRHHAAHAKLADIIRDELEHNASDVESAIRLVLGLQAVHARLTTEIVAEYEVEAVRASTPEQQRAERIQRLLCGASFDTSGLDYDFDRCWHVCIIAVGDDAAQAATATAATLNRQLLPIRRGREIVWAWLGAPRVPDMSDVQRVLLEAETPGIIIAFGEPGSGIDGWRLTHRQAQAALRVALAERKALTRYSDVALIAPWLVDYSLARSFIDIYLSPLNDLAEDGAIARETLREYFKAGHQVVAAAAALRVDRSTLRKRLAAIESRLGYALCTRQAELEVALRLEILPYGDETLPGPLGDPRVEKWLM
jgi:hypothetical protein